MPLHHRTNHNADTTRRQEHSGVVVPSWKQTIVFVIMSLKPLLRVFLYLSIVVILSQLILLIQFHRESRLLLPRYMELSLTNAYHNNNNNNNHRLGSSFSFQNLLQPLQQHEPIDTKKYAYAFVMSGVDPDRPKGYRGILFSILVVAQTLHNSNSQADIVVLVQMSHETTTNVLPPTDLSYFQAYPRIVIHYLPKPIRAPTFYEAQFDKFRVLELTQYSRILYLDADVMPLCSLDYLFHLSEQGIFKENMLLARNNEPSNGGFMMLRPGPGEYQQLTHVMYQRDGRVLVTAPNLTFDEVLGWGHVIQPPDYWRTRYNLKRGTLWNFTTAYGNQGLMYYWAKYVKQSVSLFVGNEVENWIASSNSSSPILESIMIDALKGYECPARKDFPYDKNAKPPYDMEGQMYHFGGKFEKPWMQDHLAQLRSGNKVSYRPYQMWFRLFDQVQERLHIKIDIHKELRHDPALGSWTTTNDFQKSMQKKYAYAFVMAGVDPDHPQGYRGILFSILVVAQILEAAGSTADIVVLVQMAYDTEWNYLSTKDRAYLTAYPSIVITYLPKPKKPPSFYLAQFDKFRVLELTQYRRILYLDADVMPLCSLDYLFYMSERGVFKDNMVLAGNNEPSNGGFMMVRPGNGEYQRLLDVIYECDGRVLSTPNLTFDEVVGWGHVIQPPDYWRTRYNRNRGTFWNFTTAYGNQGLMYYWAKYVKQSASLFVGNEVENWGESQQQNGSSSGPVLESTLVDAIKGYECPSRMELPYDRDTIPPYDMEGQLWHFGGKSSKPWMQDNLTEILLGIQKSYYPYQVWFREFEKVQQRLNITVNIETDLRHDPALGSWTTMKDLERSMRKKHAYALVLPGVDSRYPEWYRGILFGILVVAEILESSGSKADLVVMVQMAAGSDSNVLSKDDLAYLRAYPNIVIHYLPKPSKARSSAYESQWLKYHVLELTEYRRVLYLGADVMPLCNLDYLFYMSERGVIKENFVIAGNNEPANSAFMMLRPGVGEYERLMAIVEKQNAVSTWSSSSSSTTDRFDKNRGWGHVIQAPDRWRTRYDRKTGTTWDFSAAAEEQGLLYYWVKYVKKNVSLFIGNEVENWSSLSRGGGEAVDGGEASVGDDPILESTMTDIIQGHDVCPSRIQFPYDKYAKPPYDLEGQIWHFWSQDHKPWTISRAELTTTSTQSSTTDHLPYQIWFETLDRVKLRLNLKPVVSVA